MAQHAIADKKEVSWSEVENGDLVYIPGNLVDNKPTCTYGPHKVHDKDKRELINGKGRTFYERWPTLFILPELARQRSDLVDVDIPRSDDTGGYVRIGFNGNPADGDKLYFDDISITPVTSLAGAGIFVGSDPVLGSEAIVNGDMGLVAN